MVAAPRSAETALTGSVRDNLEDDLAGRVASSTELEGVTCAGERKDLGNDRLERSFVHERGDLIQLRAVSLDDEIDATNAVLLGDTWRNP